MKTMGYRNVVQLHQQGQNMGRIGAEYFKLVVQLTGETLNDFGPVLRRFPDTEDSFCHNFLKFEYLKDGEHEDAPAWLYLNNKHLSTGKEHGLVRELITELLLNIQKTIQDLQNSKEKYKKYPFIQDRTYIESLRRLTAEQLPSVSDYAKAYPLRNFENSREIQNVAVTIHNGMFDMIKESKKE